MAITNSPRADNIVDLSKSWPNGAPGHHHMALVMMAMLFMLDERMRHQYTYPLLSCSEIEELLSRFLPRRDVSQQKVIRQLEHPPPKAQVGDQIPICESMAWRPS